MYSFKSLSMTPRRFGRAVLLGVGIFFLLASKGCPPNPPPGGDTTPPEFPQNSVAVQVFERGVQPTPPDRGTVDITSRDVNRANMASNLVIRVKASAGDSGSGIREIKVVSNLRWQCAFGRGSQTIGPLEGPVPMNFTPHVLPSTSTQVWQINEVADPISMIPCDTTSPGHGPVSIAGGLWVEATNGAGLTSRSGAFTFDYTDIGVRQ